MPVDFSVTNQLASPAIYASSFATRPAASFKGRLFVDTDNPSSGIYRDTGTAWIAIAGTSVGEIQSLNDVCVVGNSTTTLGIEIFGQSAFGENISPPYGPMPPFGDYALTIGNYSEFQSSLYVQDYSFFNTRVGINTSLTTPLLIGGDTTTSTLTYRTTSAAGITGARHIFQVGNNGATEAMTILNNGNVGIGTTSPTAAKFVLNSGTSNQNALINGDKISFTRTSDAAEVVYFKKDTSLGIEGTANINGYDGIQFRTQGAESVKAVITSSGNVLIGTTTDAGYKFDCNGTARLGNLTGATATFIGTLSTNAGFGIVSGGGGYAVGPSGTRGVIAINGSGDQLLTFSTDSYIYSSSILFRMLSSADIDFVSGGIQRLLISASTGAVGINTTTPDASALLDVTSTTKGFLPPRMTTTQINAITSPAAGLVVYNTTLAVLCFYDGTGWKKVSHSAM